MGNRWCVPAPPESQGILSPQDWCHTNLPQLKSPPSPDSVSDPLARHLLRIYEQKAHIPEEDFYSTASRVTDRVNQLLKDLRKWLADHGASFTIEKLVASGSSAEGLKTGSPNEFDVMLQIKMNPKINYNLEYVRGPFVDIKVTSGYFGIYQNGKWKDLSNPEDFKKCIFDGMQQLGYKCVLSGGPAILLLDLESIADVDIVPFIVKEGEFDDDIVLVPVKEQWRLSLSLPELQFWKQFVAYPNCIIILRLLKLVFYNLEKKGLFVMAYSSDIVKNLCMHCFRESIDLCSDYRDLGTLLLEVLKSITTFRKYLEPFMFSAIVPENLRLSPTLKSSFNLNLARERMFNFPLLKLHLQCRLLTDFDIDSYDFPLSVSDRSAVLCWLPDTITQKDVLHHCSAKCIDVTDIMTGAIFVQRYQAFRLIFCTIEDKKRALKNNFWWDLLHCEDRHGCPTPVLLEITTELPCGSLPLLGQNFFCKFVQNNEQEVEDSWASQVSQSTRMEDKNILSKTFYRLLRIDPEKHNTELWTYWGIDGVRIFRDPDPNPRSRLEDMLVVVAPKSNSCFGVLQRKFGFELAIWTSEKQLEGIEHRICGIKELSEKLEDAIRFEMLEKGAQLDERYYRRGIWRDCTGSTWLVFKTSDDKDRYVQTLMSKLVSNGLTLMERIPHYLRARLWAFRQTVSVRRAVLPRVFRN